MITKTVGGRIKRGTSRKAAAVARVPHTVRYVSKDAVLQDKNGEDLRFTNMASDSPEAVIEAMEKWKTLRPGITDPVRHQIVSPEPGDRELVAGDWQKMIDIYREKRELGDAPYYAQVEVDENGPHLHLMYLRIRSDGSVVPDSWDAKVNFDASRAIESELGLMENAGKDRMFNGKSRAQNRDRAAERDGFSPENSHANIDKIQQAIAESQSPGQLFHKLKEQGIEAMFSRRGDDQDSQIHGWKLRLADGPKEWTSGSKLDADRTLSWSRVEARLAQNRLGNTQARLDRMEAIAHQPRRAQVHTAAQAPARRTESLEDSVQRAASEGLDYLKQILSALGPRATTPGMQRLADRIVEAEQKLAATGVELDGLPAKTERDALFQELEQRALDLTTQEVQEARVASEKARDEYNLARDAADGLKFDKKRHWNIPRNAPDSAERRRESELIKARKAAFVARNEARLEYKKLSDRFKENMWDRKAKLWGAAGFAPDSAKADFNYRVAKVQREIKESTEVIDKVNVAKALRRHLKKELRGDTSTVQDLTEKREKLEELQREKQARERAAAKEAASAKLAEAQREQARLQEIRRQQEVARAALRAARQQQR